MDVDILRLSTELQCKLLYHLTASSPSDLPTMLDEIVRHTADVLKASACSVFIIDSEGSSATQLAGTGHQAAFAGAKCKVLPADQVPDAPEEDEKLGLTGWILSTGRSFLAQSPEELEQHPHRTGRHDPAQLPAGHLRLQTFLGVPLRGLYGEVLGLIKAERRQDEQTDEKTESFSITDQIVLETVARVASKCRVYLGIAESGRLEDAITAWARDVVAEAVATEGDLDNFLGIVVSVMAAAMHADSCGVYLADKVRKTLTQRAGIGSQAPRFVIRSYPLFPADQLEANRPVGLTAWIAATGIPVWASNKAQLREHPHHQGRFDRWNFPQEEGTICGAFLGVPLKIGGTVIGVLKVENISIVSQPDTRVFSEQAYRRFDVLAQDTALDIVRLQEQSGARYEVILEAQKPISEILRGGLDIRKLVEKVVTNTADLLHARACVLFLVEGDRLVQPPWAAVGYFAKGPLRQYTLVNPEQIKDPPSPSEKVGLTVWIAATRQKFTARSNLELLSHPHHKGTFDEYNFEGDQRCESFMGVPLTVGGELGELVGVFKVETKTKLVEGIQEYTYFSGQDELVFEMIANSAASAIENARLVAAQRLAEQLSNQRQNVLLILHDYARDAWYAAGTLHKAAGLLMGEMSHLARIVDHFAYLLEPDASRGYLEALLKALEQPGESAYKGAGPMSILYRILADALDAKTLSDIRDLCKQPNLWDPALEREPFVASSAAILRRLFQQISATLEARLGVGQQPQLAAHLEQARTAAIDLYQPEKSLLSRMVEHWAERVRSEVAFCPVDKNPYLTGQPVSPDSGAPFFGRHEIFKWLEANLEGTYQRNVIALYGERRMGKTSILLQLQRGPLGEPLRTRAGHPICPVYVDLQEVANSDNATILLKIAKEIHDQLNATQATPVLPKLPSKQAFAQDPYNAFGEYLRQVDKALDQVILVLMLDEFEVLDKGVREHRLDTAIYSQLRHHLQHSHNVAFILAGMHQLTRLSNEYRSMIYSNALHQEVGFMDEKSARELIQKPVAGQVIYEEAAVEELLHLTNGHPYLLQSLCHRLIDQMNQAARSNTITIADVHSAALHYTSEPLFFSFLRDYLTDSEDRVLSALALQTDGIRVATAADLASRLGDSSNEIDVTLQRMGDRKLVRQQPNAVGTASYTLSMPLFQQWLGRFPAPVSRLGGQ
jgi:GAF domain-containing protein